MDGSSVDATQPPTVDEVCVCVCVCVCVISLKIYKYVHCWFDSSLKFVVI